MSGYEESALRLFAVLWFFSVWCVCFVWRSFFVSRVLVLAHGLLPVWGIKHYSLIFRGQLWP